MRIFILRATKDAMPCVPLREHSGPYRVWIAIIPHSSVHELLLLLGSNIGVNMRTYLIGELDMKYPGAIVVKKDKSWWIEYDLGEAGPFDTYEEAAHEAEPNDEPMEVRM